MLMNTGDSLPLRETKKREVLKALNTYATQTEAALKLGIDRGTLADLIKAYGIKHLWVLAETPPPTAQ
jgi:predicted DNA-binding protein (UPF0251 family)